MSRRRLRRIGPRTKRQADWLRAYLGEARYNATEAARIAGYSERSAHSIGSELRHKPHIRAAIDLHMLESSADCLSRTHRTAEEIRAMIREEVARILTTGEAPEET